MQAPSERGTRPVATAERTDAVVTDPYGMRRDTALRVSQAIYLIFGIVEVLIAIRFVLRLLGANAEAGFASLINRISTPLVAPFAGLSARPSSTATSWSLKQSWRSSSMG